MIADNNQIRQLQITQFILLPRRPRDICVLQQIFMVARQLYEYASGNCNGDETIIFSYKPHSTTHLTLRYKSQSIFLRCANIIAD